MKTLKEILEASILADIDDQLEYGDEVLKSMIIEWLKANAISMQENKLNFNFNTAPITVNYGADIRFKNNIESLTNGTFQWGEVRGNFSCTYCASLKSLEGAPKEVGGNFSCHCCKSLKSLKGAPKEVGEYCYCNYCESLKSLNGAPKEVGKSFYCDNCASLKSLNGAPKKVEGEFWCNKCGSKFTVDDVEHICKVKGRIYC